MSTSDPSEAELERILRSAFQACIRLGDYLRDFGRGMKTYRMYDGQKLAHLVENCRVAWDAARAYVELDIRQLVGFSLNAMSNSYEVCYNVIDDFCRGCNLLEREIQARYGAGDEVAPPLSVAAQPENGIVVDADHQTISVQGRLIRWGGNESWQSFLRLWKARPNTVSIDKNAVKEIRDYLRSNGLVELADAIKNQHGVGYYIDLPT